MDQMEAIEECEMNGADSERRQREEDAALASRVGLGMRRGWDWAYLRRHPNAHVRRAAASNLTSGRQTAAEKRSVGIGTSGNYFGSGQASVGVARGSAIAGTGKPVGA